jgi:hypothetical protein
MMNTESSKPDNQVDPIYISLLLQEEGSLFKALQSSDK